MKVSVITVVLNNFEKVERAIKSVKGQTYEDLEYIVIDGGSTDGTVDVIKKYGGFISKWVSEPDGGIYDAFNKGIRLSTGDVVGFLGSDDFYAEATVIEKVVGRFKESGADGVYGDLLYVNREGRIIRYWRGGKYRRELIQRGWMPPHPTLFLKNELYRTYGLYRTDMRVSADYEMCLRLLWKANIKLDYIPEVLVIMERGGISNRSIMSKIRTMIEDYRAIKDNEVGGIDLVILKRLTKMHQFIKLRSDVYKGDVIVWF
ncbi:MAG: glycosyltransferase family 2 protein [Deltaproteobacteria bacterium]|nr:glycosyltransferase family 2 protein [Deltaproteobacteria bacterium]